MNGPRRRLGPQSARAWSPLAVVLALTASAVAVLGTMRLLAHLLS